MERRVRRAQPPPEVSLHCFAFTTAHGNIHGTVGRAAQRSRAQCWLGL